MHPELAVFSAETADRLLQVDGEYANGSLVFCLTAARFPAFARHASRLQSLQRASHLDESSRIRWSDAGFFLQDDGSAACFHCGARVKRVPADHGADPLRLHERCSAFCELLRLLKVVHGVLSERNDRVMESGAKLKRALAKLRMDLQQRSSIINQIESFGFTRSNILFCACRVFMTQGGCLPDRPGDLMEQLHECERLLPDCGHVIDVESALRECASLQSRGSADEERRSSADQERRSTMDQERQTTGESQQCLSPPNSSCPNAQPPVAEAAAKPAVGRLTHQISEEAADEAPTASTRDSDKCVQCRARTRDHVTLPCAHFLLCRDCLRSRADCPSCGARVLAAIRAFIS